LNPYLYRDRVAALALQAKLPTVAAFPIENGALMSYGTDTSESLKRAGYYAPGAGRGRAPLPGKTAGRTAWTPRSASRRRMFFMRCATCAFSPRSSACVGLLIKCKDQDSI